VTAQPNAEQIRSGRIKLLAMALFFAFPVVAGYVAYFFDFVPHGSGNYGTLIAPRPLSDATLKGVDGRPFKLSELRGKWLLVQFDSGACDAYCERKLYFMRQVRKALGRDTSRVERVWLLTDDSAPNPRLLDAVEGTRIASAGGSGFASEFPAEASRVDHIYVIDPLGNLMMRFPRDPDPSKMLKDVQRLLKLSGIG